jgi:hypothetical protein
MSMIALVSAIIGFANPADIADHFSRLVASMMTKRSK